MTGTHDRDLIETSLALAAERGGDLTPLVYARLFAAQPQLERLFWRDRDGKIKGEMLAHALGAILDFVGERHYADHLIASSAQIHTEYDVPPDVFRTFFPVVAATIAELLGAAWTAETAAAWARLLVQIDACASSPQSAPAAR